MLRALERGISIKDFEILTVGMILDYITTCNNEHYAEEDGEENTIKMADQRDMDNF